MSLKLILINILFTVFTFITRFGYIEIFEMLLESGVDVHTNNDEALMGSVAKGDHYITNRLIQSGASTLALDYKWKLQI
jgi:hypothetical protein